MDSYNPEIFTDSPCQPRNIVSHAFRLDFISRHGTTIFPRPAEIDRSDFCPVPAAASDVTLSRGPHSRNLDCILEITRPPNPRCDDMNSRAAWQPNTSRRDSASLSRHPNSKLRAKMRQHDKQSLDTRWTALLDCSDGSEDLMIDFGWMDLRWMGRSWC